MLDSTNNDPDFMIIITTVDESWMYGYDPEPVIFLTMKIRLEHLHYLTKCYLASTDAIDMREKLTHAYEGSRSPHASALH